MPTCICPIRSVESLVTRPKDALHAALPAGWAVGRPSYDDERREWVQYAFDPSERPKVSLRTRERTAIVSPRKP